MNQFNSMEKCLQSIETLLLKIYANQQLTSAPTPMALVHQDWEQDKIAQSLRISTDLRNSQQQYEDAAHIKKLQKSYYWNDTIVEGDNCIELQYTYWLNSGTSKWGRYRIEDRVCEVEKFNSVREARERLHELYETLPPILEEKSKILAEKIKDKK